MARLILKDEVYAIVSSAIEVLNVRGHGLHEKVYENCLAIECRLRGIPFVQQQRHVVTYKGETVGEYVPDLVLYGSIIVDTKTIDQITDHERGQILNYLRITGLPVGIILNFKHARLEWERLVLTQQPGTPSPETPPDLLGQPPQDSDADSNPFFIRVN